MLWRSPLRCFAASSLRRFEVSPLRGVAAWPLGRLFFAVLYVSSHYILRYICYICLFRFVVLLHCRCHFAAWPLNRFALLLSSYIFYLLHLRYICYIWSFLFIVLFIAVAASQLRRVHLSQLFHNTFIRESIERFAKLRASRPPIREIYIYKISMSYAG